MIDLLLMLLYIYTVVMLSHFVGMGIEYLYMRNYPEPKPTSYWKNHALLGLTWPVGYMVYFWRFVTVDLTPEYIEEWRRTRGW